MRTEKGISPMIATVLLIAFTVAVGGLVSVWMTSFTRTTTSEVSNQEETKIYCSYAGISISDVNYCSYYLWGAIENTNLKPIGNITLQIFWNNATTPQKIYLCQDGSVCTTASSMELSPGEHATFNVSIGGSNYDKVRVYTNCSEVDDEAPSAYITSC
jgi:flagellin-like protein